MQKHAEVAQEYADISVLYVTSCSSSKKLEVEVEEVNGVKIHRVYYPKIRHSILLVSNLIKLYRYLHALNVGWKRIKKPIDLVHVHVAFPVGLFAYYLKKRHHLKYLITEHWSGYQKAEDGYRSMNPIFRLIIRIIFRNAELVLPVSEHLGNCLEKLKLIDHYQVLFNVIDSEYFFPAENKDFKSKTYHFLHVSTFNDPQKNISGMLSAFKMLNKPYHLNLVTENNEEKVYHLLKQYQIPLENVTVRSQLSTYEIGQIMRESDCFILFSNHETFSIVVVESWMSGIPAIYTKCGGITEIKDPKLGVQIPIKDVQRLLIELNNFDNAQYSSEEIHQFAIENFSKEIVAKKLDNIYQQY